MPKALVLSLCCLASLVGCSNIDYHASGSAPLSSATPPARVNYLPNLGAAGNQRIARAIWRNECAGSVSGMLGWNVGENFASLGIGHFIWYPQGQRGIYQESFPALVQFALKRGIEAPEWMRGACPWNTRQQFMADKNARQARMVYLMQWLERNLPLQGEFVVARARSGLAKIVAASAKPGLLDHNLRLLGSVAQGQYCLIDYVNFKGEGLNPAERYANQGWGLLQVLEGMPKCANAAQACNEFSASAARVLARRVATAPAARGEQRWLKGWQARCKTYSAGL